MTNTTGTTSGAGTANPSGAPEFTPSFWCCSCYSIFSFICMFCRSLFVLFSFTHYVVCSSLIYRFWLLLWNLPTLLSRVWPYVIVITTKLRLHQHWQNIFDKSHRMVIGFTTTYAISAYHHQSCDFEPRSWPGVLDTALCDKVC